MLDYARWKYVLVSVVTLVALLFAAPNFFGEDQALQVAFERAWEDGRRPYLIPLGGSNATGALAYAYAMQELLAQGVQPEWIVVASSSGGTQAGLVLGARRANFPGRILGISIDEAQDELCKGVAALSSAASERFGEKMVFAPEDVLVNADYLGEGYGVFGALEQEAIRLFARREGILLDPVYTGRAAGGMIDLVRRGFFHPGQTVLFWHTGGAPALFAAAYQADLLK